MSIKKSGFTLVEIMVAVSIFTVVAVIATGAVITANNVNKKSQAIKLVVDNLNFALDSMTLKLKQGGGYYCDSDTGNVYPVGADSRNCSGESRLAFRVEDGVGGYDYYIYLFSGNKLRFSKGIGSSASMSPLVPITSDDVNISIGRFYVFDNGLPDKQPRALISVYGTATAGKQSSSFAIETTVSDRR